MTWVLVTLDFIVVGIPLFVGFMVARWSIKKNTLAKTLIGSPLSAALSGLLLFILGVIAAVLVNCSMHPGPDCEHFDDTCLRAFWDSDNGDWMNGDRHSCPGHV